MVLEILEQLRQLVVTLLNRLADSSPSGENLTFLGYILPILGWFWGGLNGGGEKTALAYGRLICDHGAAENSVEVGARVAEIEIYGGGDGGKGKGAIIVR